MRYYFDIFLYYIQYQFPLCNKHFLCVLPPVESPNASIVNTFKTHLNAPSWTLGLMSLLLLRLTFFPSALTVCQAEQMLDITLSCAPGTFKSYCIKHQTTNQLFPTSLKYNKSKLNLHIYKVTMYKLSFSIFQMEKNKIKSSRLLQSNDPLAEFKEISWSNPCLSAA